MPNVISPYIVAEPVDTSSRTSNTLQTEGTSGSGSMIDAVFGDGSDRKVTIESFLTSMATQLRNQDFMNPVDDTQHVTQLAQISAMQQMEEMSYSAKNTYMAFLVGEHVATVKSTVPGESKKIEEIVDKMSLLDEELVVYVNGESYNMDEIMEIKTGLASNPDGSGNKKPGEDKNPEGGNDKAQCMYKTDSNRIRAQEDKQWIQ